MTTIRILIVDDSPEFLRSTQNYLKRFPEVEVAGSAENGNQAIQKTAELQPDLVLLDFYLPDINGIEVTRQISTRFPQTQVILISLYDVAQYRQAALEAGAHHFIPKSQLYELLPDILKEKSMKKKAPYRILVVDDSPTVRKMIISALKTLHADFDEAGNGLEALEQLALERFDLITLDLNMPDMHGIEFLHFIRKTEQYRTLPVVVITTRGDEDSFQKATGLGAMRYVTKPFSPPDLLQAVQEVLGK